MRNKNKQAIDEIKRPIYTRKVLGKKVLKKLPKIFALNDFTYENKQ